MRNKYVLLLLSIPVVLTLLLFPKVSAMADETDDQNTEVSEELEEPIVPESSEVNIYYDCTGGSLDNVENYRTSFLLDEIITLPTPQREGYLFEGWLAMKGREKCLDDVNNAVILKNKETGERYVKLYAKWKEPVAYAPEIATITNPVKGSIVLTFDRFYREADGYQIELCTDGKFEERVRRKDSKYINGAIVLKNKAGQRPYSVRVRSYVIDSAGERFYSPYSNVRVIYLFNGADEVDPTPTSAEMQSCRIENGALLVTAELQERVASFDDVYHFVKVDPISGDVIGSIATVEKDDMVVASLPIAGNLMSKIALAVKEDESSYTIISNGRYIDNPEALASYTAAYPTPASKKGRQGAYDTGMGDKHTFHNVYLEQLVGSAASHDVAYNYNGKTYYFYTPTHHVDYNSLIRAANNNGGTVTMQLMIRWSGQASDMICPTGRTPGYNYYAFNMEETAGREKVEALFMFLAEYWSKSGLHVDNWILGNEVNTYLNTTGRWYWAGNISRDAFMNNYSNTFRALYYAVKSHNANARVFTCCDHTWNDRDRDWGARGFMLSLDSYLEDMNPNIQWNLAYHAYTAVLTNSDPWNDGRVRIYSVAHSNSASFVSPYNLEVMSNFVADNFGPNCRIILSEVGFSYTGGTNPTLNGGRQSGADVQAAATAYLYFKAHFTSNIDACIFHTGDEGEAGKNFRIEGMPAGTVYRYMDTPSYADYCNGYLGLIGGATSWESVIPGFNSAALLRMPSR